MNTSIFITVEPIVIETQDYGGVFEDTIGVCPHTGDVHIVCRGQWTARDDHKVINNMQAHIFSRMRKTDAFTYWGLARKTNTVARILPVGASANNVRDLNLFIFKIDSVNVVNVVIPRNPEYNGTGCLKKACLAHIGYTDANMPGNMMPCFL